jgi:hypothetical protein
MFESITFDPDGAFHKKLNRAPSGAQCGTERDVADSTSATRREKVSFADTSSMVQCPELVVAYK